MDQLTIGGFSMWQLFFELIQFRSPRAQAH
jgi:hypothetical protein